MIRFSFIRKIAVCLLFTCGLSGLVAAAELTYEDANKIHITWCRGRAYPPDNFGDEWRGVHYFKFDNGMWGTRTRLFKDESEARQHAAEECSGAVNLVYRFDEKTHEHFAVVFKDSKNSTISLWFERDYSFPKFPRLKSITENVEVISYWFSKEYLYRYVFELDDGRIFVTGPFKAPWTEFWETDKEVHVLGNTQSWCLIDVNAVRAQSHFVIKPEFVVSDLQLLSQDKKINNKDDQDNQDIGKVL
jgi:hypothetical protein